MGNILLTGASGFLGGRIATVLNAWPGCRLSLVLRKSVTPTVGHVFNVPSIDGNTDWTAPLQSQRVVVHVAAIAHSSYGIPPLFNGDQK